MIEYREITPEEVNFIRELEVIRKDFGIVIGYLILGSDKEWFGCLKTGDFGFLGKVSEEEAKKKYQRMFLDKYDY